MRKSNLNPIFFEKTKDGEKIFDVSSRLMKDRVIYLDCEIEEEVASQITAILFLLDREDESKKISLWINSPGGDAPGFFAIYDMMHRIKAPVQTVCIGEACSASAILLAAGTPGMRYAMPSSRVMLHQIQVEGLGGSNAEIEIDTKELKEMQEYLTEILARHTGHTKAKIKRDTKMDKWFSAETAVEYGIVDKILMPVKTKPELLTREVKKKISKDSAEPKNSKDEEEDDGAEE
jgi:ATP-dependent Clp protease, protease subunit